MLAGLAPEVGIEPTTNRLTADRSTAELLRIIARLRGGSLFFRYKKSSVNFIFRL